MAPRISYLPLITPRLLAFFNQDLIHKDATAAKGWFEVDGVPLKWHQPIGLLYDLYSGAKEALVAETTGAVTVGVDDGEGHGEGQVQPWNLTVHFSEWPEDKLVKLDTEGKVLQSTFNNAVKEASAIRHGSGKVVMALGREETNALWEGVVERTCWLVGLLASICKLSY